MKKNFEAAQKLNFLAEEYNFNHHYLDDFEFEGLDNATKREFRTASEEFLESL
jgi:homoserine dehydrogenase